MRLPLALIGLLALGCDDGGPTEILVMVESDLRVPADLDAVRFEIDAVAIGDGLFARRAQLSSAADLPASLALRHAGGPLGPIEVAAIGELDGEDSVGTAASTAFVAGELVTLRLWLLAECVGREGCGGEDGGVALDASTDGGADDAGPPDAGPPDAGLLCPGECAATCEPTCTEESCRCDDRCSCNLACPIDADCHAECDEDASCRVTAPAGLDAEVKCHTGALCIVDGREVSNFYADCDGSRCEVDCRGASNCLVKCHHEAQCLVRCSGASNCRFDSCTGARPCADGVLVCNRDCP